MELDDLVASECIFCGDIMIKMIDAGVELMCRYLLFDGMEDKFEED